MGVSFTKFTDPSRLGFLFLTTELVLNKELLASFKAEVNL